MSGRVGGAGEGLFVWYGVDDCRPTAWALAAPSCRSGKLSSRLRASKCHRSCRRVAASATCPCWARAWHAYHQEAVKDLLIRVTTCELGVSITLHRLQVVGYIPL